MTKKRMSKSNYMLWKKFLNIKLPILQQIEEEKDIWFPLEKEKKIGKNYLAYDITNDSFGTVYIYSHEYNNRSFHEDLLYTQFTLIFNNEQEIELFKEVISEIASNLKEKSWMKNISKDNQPPKILPRIYNLINDHRKCLILSSFIYNTCI